MPEFREEDELSRRRARKVHVSADASPGIVSEVSLRLTYARRAVRVCGDFHTTVELVRQVVSALRRIGTPADLALLRTTLQRLDREVGVELQERAER